MDNDFDLSPLKTKWDFFLGRMEGDENLETQRLNSTEIKLSMVSHFLWRPQGILIPTVSQEAHFHLLQVGTWRALHQ